MPRKTYLLSFTLLAFLILFSAPSSLKSILARPESPRPVVRYPTRKMTTRPLRNIPELPAVVYDVRKLERKMLPNRLGSGDNPVQDPVWQNQLEGPSAPATLVSFEGISNADNTLPVLPPDPVGDVGPNHYVQMINLMFAIYDKSGNLLYGPANTNTLWSGFGGPCETTNDGDPIVLYDQLADRWMMSQFALPNFPSGPFHQCIAVSQTPDPTGAWHLYDFIVSNNKLNDYPKFGIWSDGLYMAINQYTCNIFSCSWAGQGVMAFELNKMVDGDPGAAAVYFDLYSTDPNLGGMQPSDWDGSIPPPAGSPNYFVEVDDDATSPWPDQLQIWKFVANWTNPGNSTFTYAQSLNTASFDSNMCGFSRNCIQQPGGTAVDAISDRLMYRLQYRNFGTHQTLVANHTVDVDDTDHAGIRWYELRNTGSGWSIYQQGTYAPDGDHRWMGSVAMNSAGDIGLGYSVSSNSTFPSIRFNGRLDGDTLGQMTRGEGTIVAGSGYQTHYSGRWGDYSMMAVDPVDDCTFWYTQEYYGIAGNAPWKTRIGSFKLRDCGPVDNPPSVNITEPNDADIVSGDAVLIAADAFDDNGVNQVEFFVDGASLGADTTNPYSVTWDSTTVSNGGHTISATATDTIGQTATDNISVTVDNPGGAVDQVTTGEIFVDGTVSGNHTDTHADDDNVESITEQHQGGRPVNRHDSLEYIWTVNLQSGTGLAFMANAWITDLGDGDDIVFSHSTDNTNYTPFHTLNATSSSNIVYVSLPDMAPGTLYIKVEDADSTPGNNNNDTVFVDFMKVTENSGLVFNQPPNADNKNVTTDADVQADVSLTATDPEECELVFSIVDPPSKGSLVSITNAACNAGTPNSDSATVTYTPNPGYNGPDSFTYKANDGSNDSNIATVSITVGQVSGPMVTSCNPSAGYPGDRLTVTVSGSNFQNGASVDFGDRVNVQGVTFIDSSQLEVGIRVHNRASAGPRNVTVTNPDGQSDTMVGCFTVN